MRYHSWFLPFLIILVVGRPAKASPMGDFVVSCAYGVLAGTLVGAASLAFSERPGDNLNRIARGASLGLYAGILLGAYVVSSEPEAEEMPAEYALNIGSTDLILVPKPATTTHLDLKAKDPSAIALIPTFNREGTIDGILMQARLLEF